MLQNIFIRIQKNEFSTGADHVTQLKQIEQSFIGKIPVCFPFELKFPLLFVIVTMISN